MKSQKATLIKIRYLNNVMVMILDELLMNLRNIYHIHCTYLISV